MRLSRTSWPTKCGRSIVVSRAGQMTPRPSHSAASLLEILQRQHFSNARASCPPLLASFAFRFRCASFALFSHTAIRATYALYSRIGCPQDKKPPACVRHRELLIPGRYTPNPSGQITAYDRMGVRRVKTCKLMPVVVKQAYCSSTDRRREAAGSRIRSSLHQKGGG